MKYFYILAALLMLLTSCANDNEGIIEAILFPEDGITLTPSELDFGKLKTNTNSTSKSFRLTVSNVTDEVFITVPTGFYISKQNTSGYSSSLSFMPENGSVNCTVYIYFRPTVVKSYSGNVECSSSNTTPAVLYVSGTGTRY